jgi:hypothetical protein
MNMEPRSPSMDLQVEYLALKSFVFAFPGLDTELPASNSFQVFNALEAYEVPLLKRDLAGMKMAINDCICASSHWSSGFVFAADAALRQRGILTLSEVRRRYSKGVAKILVRGRIKSEVEHYLVDGILADSACEISKEERASLEYMSESYRLNSAQPAAAAAAAAAAVCYSDR